MPRAYTVKTYTCMQEFTVKVDDLYKMFFSIDRDISELKETMQKLPDDREYTLILKRAIQSEIEKLEKRRKLILDLEVKMGSDSMSIIQKESSAKKEELVVSSDTPQTKLLNGQETHLLAKRKNLQRY